MRHPSLPRLGIVDSRFLPPFSAMARALAEQLHLGQFRVALGQTLRGWALGLAWYRGLRQSERGV